MPADHDLILQKLILGKSSAQSVLFYGTEGAPLEQWADRLARGWMCSQPVEGAACGDCPVCLAMDRRSSLDYLPIRPWGAQRLIKLRAVVPGANDAEYDAPPISEFVTRSPFQARVRVVRIDDADRMNADAANALLKMLEEPQARAKMILTTQQLSGVLATIQSRCLCLAVAIPPPPEGLDAMTLLFSEGTPGLRQRIESQPAFYRELYRILEELPGLGPSGALLGAERFRDVEKLWEGEDWTARAIHAEQLRCLGLWVRRRMPYAAPLIQEVAQVHRKILGNAGWSLQTDPLFCALFRAFQTKELSTIAK